MAHRSDDDVEDHCRKGSRNHDGPETINISFTGVGDAEESHGDAALDDGGTCGVEELGDEEGLSAVVSLESKTFGENTYFDSFHFRVGRQNSSFLP